MITVASSTHSKLASFHNQIMIRISGDAPPHYFYIFNVFSREFLYFLLPRDLYNQMPHKSHKYGQSDQSLILLLFPLVKLHKYATSEQDGSVQGT